MTATSSSSRARRLSAGRIVGIYVAVAAAYIWVSTGLMSALAGDLAQLETLEIGKGLVFVLVTGSLLWGLLRAHEKRVDDQLSALAERDHKLADANRREVTLLEAATLAHDLNNALIVLEACVEDATDLAGDPQRAEREARSAIEEVRGLARRLGNTVHEREREEARAVDFDTVFERASRLTRAHVDGRHCRLQMRIEDAPRSLGTVGEALQMTLNLLLNAAQAAGPDGTVEVSCRRSGSRIEILVDDDGPGVPQHLRGRVLEPGMSTKPNGCGLGLVAVRRAVERFDGELHIENSPLGGARFRILLPALETAQA